MGEWLDDMLGIYWTFTETVKWFSKVAVSFPGGSDGKESPAMWETWVQSVGWEDPLAEDMATHSSILAWRILMDSGAWRAAVAAPFYTQQTEYASSSSSTSHHPLAFF